MCKKIDKDILKKYKDGKLCKKCNRILSLKNFNIRKISGKYRPFSYCKECEHEMNNNKYEHTCLKCGKTYRSGKKKTNICSECRNEKFKEIGRENLKKMNANQSGENNHMYGVHRYGKDNPNYNHLKTDEEREKGRIILGYKEWREQVYKRDNYTCQCCGDNKGGNLNAHHLYSYDKYKCLRTIIENGVCLCDKCHMDFHKIYGNGNNTKEQFEKFIAKIKHY